jgi:hypothetical protein
VGKAEQQTDEECPIDLDLGYYGKDGRKYAENCDDYHHKSLGFHNSGESLKSGFVCRKKKLSR